MTNFESRSTEPEARDSDAWRTVGACDDRVGMLLAMRRHLHIVHHIPGRLRLRASAGLLELARAWRSRRMGLDEAIEVIDGIRSARVNPMAASAVIEYDRKRLPPDAWRRLLDGSDAEALEVLRNHVPGLDRELQEPESSRLESTSRSSHR